MKHRIVAVLAVSVVSACGGRAQPAPASQASVRAVPEATEATTKNDTSDDYVVGPFVSDAGDGDEAVRTYYIVRN